MRSTSDLVSVYCTYSYTATAVIDVQVDFKEKVVEILVPAIARYCDIAIHVHGYEYSIFCEMFLLYLSLIS